MKVLAVSGWKKSGKDTLADYLIANYGATRVSFADPLKELVANEFGISRDCLDNPELKEKPLLTLPVDPQDAFGRMLSEFLVKEFRTAAGLQPLGFEYFNGKFYGRASNSYLPERLFWTPRALAILKGSSNRAVQSDFWVAPAIDLAQSVGGLVVISDLRYQSELNQLRVAFGADLTTLRVQRYETSPSNDPSERNLDHAYFDFQISNRGTLNEFYAQIDAVLKSAGIK